MPPRRSGSRTRTSVPSSDTSATVPTASAPQTPRPGRTSTVPVSTPYQGPPLQFDDDLDVTTSSSASAEALIAPPTPQSATRSATRQTYLTSERSNNPVRASSPPTPASSSYVLAALDAEQAAKMSKSLIRRQKLLRRLHLYRLVAVLPALLVLIGSILPLVLSVPPTGPFYSNDANNGISKGTYVDENALQPGQAYTYFNYHFDVPYADEVAATLSELGSLAAPPDEHAKNWVGKFNDAQRTYLAQEFTKLGMPSYVQPYSFDLPAPQEASLPGHLAANGTNLFARFSPPRTDTREAIVLSAPWYTSWTGSDPNDPDSRRNNWPNAPHVSDPDQERRVNIRGVATVLAMARYFVSRPQSYLSRDYYFVISDGHLAGAQAWLANYYRTHQANLEVDTCAVDGSKTKHWDVFGGSVIWNALAVEYPSDSFRAIEVMHEGLNGQLPNMDALNSVVRVAEQVGAISVNIPSVPASSWPAKMVAVVTEAVADGKARLERALGYQPAQLFSQHTDALIWSEYAQRDYAISLQRIWRQWALQASGTTSSIHGLFTRYHVDAVTIRAIPATGPFGFFHMGRIVEGSLRSYNNLLERLHHSQFFYLLLSGYRFVPFGVYLPAALLIAVGVTIAGLQSWKQLSRLIAQRQEHDFEHCVRFIVKELVSESKVSTDKAQLDVLPPSPTPDLYARELYHLALSLASDKTSASSFNVVQRAIVKTRSNLVAAGRPLGTVCLLVAAAHGLACVALLQLYRIELEPHSPSLQLCEPLKLAAGTLLLSPPIVALVASLLTSSKSTTPNSNQVAVHLAGPLLHTVALLHAGVIIAVTSVLNFPLAMVTAQVLGWPLLLLRRSPGQVGTRRSAVYRALVWSFLGAPQALLLLERSLTLPTTVLEWFGPHVANPPAWFGPVLSTIASWAPTFGSLANSLTEAVQARLWDWHVLQTYPIPYAVHAYSVVATEAALGAWLDVWG